jgi:hypothetical protein
LGAAFTFTGALALGAIFFTDLVFLLAMIVSISVT